jgi:hypothetical protein
MEATPILILAFSRIESLENIFKTLDKTQPRSVLISFDGLEGANSKHTEKVRQNYLNATSWAEVTKHKVNIIQNKINMGCNSHNMNALRAATERFDYFFHLEDDVEFRPELIDHIDQNIEYLLRDPSWGLCGFNPAKDRNLENFNFKEPIKFHRFKTWSNFGWFAKSQNIERLLENIGTVRKDELQEIVRNVSKEICVNPIIRQKFVDYWEKKVDRATSSFRDWENPARRSGAVSWDAWTVLEVWGANKQVFKPTTCLSREGFFQFEDQEHPHDFPKNSWAELNTYEIQLISFERSKVQLNETSQFSEWKVDLISSLKFATKKLIKIVFRLVNPIGAKS